jgi:hypothetical protein
MIRVTKSGGRVLLVVPGADSKGNPGQSPMELWVQVSSLGFTRVLTRLIDETDRFGRPLRPSNTMFSFPALEDHSVFCFFVFVEEALASMQRSHTPISYQFSRPTSLCFPAFSNFNMLVATYLQ